MEKAVTPAHLNGYVFYDGEEWEFRLPSSEQEDLEFEQCLAESFQDNLRYQLFGVTKDLMAIEYRHAREWDRKNLNRIGVFDKKTGKLASVFRFGNGDKNELEPEPDQIRLHPGFIRIKEMSKKVEERARESYPENF